MPIGWNCAARRARVTEFGHCQKVFQNTQIHHRYSPSITPEEYMQEPSHINRPSLASKT
jgi:hypothetical protein